MPVRWLRSWQGHPGDDAQGTEGAWLMETFDITAYRHSTFRFRFVFESDSGVGDPGWYIDDVTISG